MAKTSAAANGNSTASVEDLSAQIEILKTDLAQLTQILSDYGIAKSEEVKQAATAKAAQYRAAGRETAQEAQSQAEEFIRTQPATALGLAAGLGFLVGMIMVRR